MAGEPAGVFDVTKLDLIETTAGVETSSRVVDVAETFKLRVTITGLGTDPTWAMFKFVNGIVPIFKLRAQFYAEGMGPGVFNQTFGVPKWLDITADSLTIDSDAVSIAAQGIYRCGVTVNVYIDLPGAPPPAPIPWMGWLGFNEDCVIEAHPFETLP